MEKEFSKADLRTGMRVMCRSGWEGIVYLNTEHGDCMTNRDTYNTLDDFRENLLSTGNDLGDIMFVYSAGSITELPDDDSSGELLYERKEYIDVQDCVDGEVYTFCGENNEVFMAECRGCYRIDYMLYAFYSEDKDWHFAFPKNHSWKITK